AGRLRRRARARTPRGPPGPPPRASRVHRGSRRDEADEVGEGDGGPAEARVEAEAEVVREVDRDAVEAGVAGGRVGEVPARGHAPEAAADEGVDAVDGVLAREDRDPVLDVELGGVVPEALLDDVRVEQVGR